MSSQLSGPEWVAYEIVLAVHEMQLAEHGGPAGIRDQGLLESALTRPPSVYLYSLEATLYDLAALYAIGLARIMRSLTATSGRPGWYARSSWN